MTQMEWLQQEAIFCCWENYKSSNSFLCLGGKFQPSHFPFSSPQEVLPIHLADFNVQLNPQTFGRKWHWCWLKIRAVKHTVYVTEGEKWCAQKLFLLQYEVKKILLLDPSRWHCSDCTTCKIMTVRVRKSPFVALTPAARLLSCSKINVGGHAEHFTHSHVYTQIITLYFEEYRIN